MRGRAPCLHCKQPIVWRQRPDEATGAWRTVKDGGIICPSSPDHKHRLGPA